MALSDPSFRIAAVDAANACHVASVFRSVYGEDFPVRDVYHPEILWQDIQAGRLASGLAFDGNGRVAGYISMFKSAPNPRLWETGNMVVVPEYTRTDISLRLIQFFTDLMESRKHDMDGIFMEAVCSHFFTQIGAAQLGMLDCAFELNQLDGASFKNGKGNKGGLARISCACSFLEMSDPVGPRYLPERYDGILRHMAESLRLRSFFSSTAALPVHETTCMEEKYYDAARTWKVSVSTIGSDWAKTVTRIILEAQHRKTISLQVMLNMASPHIGKAVDILHEQGFFFGGMAPFWFGADGLLMQQLWGSKPEYEKIKVYTQRAKDLLAFIRSDHVSVGE
jgi:hypothetical protein